MSRSSRGTLFPLSGNFVALGDPQVAECNELPGRTSRTRGGVWQAVQRGCALSLVALAAAVVVAGCGSSQPKNEAPSHQRVNAAFKGSPAPLASLHAQANQLLGGGPTAFEPRLASLQGLPGRRQQVGLVVRPVPDRVPGVPAAAVAFGKKVAFMGIDGKDQNPAAAAFLQQFPVTYPSYTDPKESDRAQDPRRDVLSHRRSTTTATAMSCSTTPVRTRASARSRRTSDATRSDDRDRPLRGAPRPRPAGDGGRAASCATTSSASSRACPSTRSSTAAITRASTWSPSRTASCSGPAGC